MGTTDKASLPSADKDKLLAELSNSWGMLRPPSQAGHVESQSGIIEAFKTAGKLASYHYADDSAREWPTADKAKAEALAIFDANPKLEAELRAIAKGFLWTLSAERPHGLDRSAK